MCLPLGVINGERVVSTQFCSIISWYLWWCYFILSQREGHREYYTIWDLLWRERKKRQVWPHPVVHLQSRHPWVQPESRWRDHLWDLGHLQCVSTAICVCVCVSCHSVSVVITSQRTNLTPPWTTSWISPIFYYLVIQQLLVVHKVIH